MATKKDKPIDTEIVEDDRKSPDVSQALVHVTGANQLTTYRDPAIVLAEAKKSADALIQVIEAQDKKVVMNGVTYITFDGWQLVGSFYGCVPKIREDKLVRIDMGDGQPPVIGYEAIADLVHMGTSNVISSATAMCLNDEDKWSEKNRYVWMYVCKDGSLSEEDPGFDNIVWEVVPGEFKADGKPKHKPKKQRELAGTVRVPLFQLRSMAQTRASSKVLREVFSHIVILAGFSPTPAEEMEEESSEERRPYRAPDEPASRTPPPPPAQPAAKKKAAPAKKQAAPPAATPQPPAPPPPPPPPPAPKGGGKVITDGQRRRLYAFTTQYGWSDVQMKACLKKEFGIDHSTELIQGRDFYDKLCDKILPLGPQKAGYK